MKKRDEFKITYDLHHIIIGLMLGDLHAERINEKRNTRLQFKQSIVNKDYIDHLYSLFKEYCGSEPKITTSKDNRVGKNELNISIKFWTLSVPCFNKFRDLYYNESGTKFIPANLEEIITARSLAYWAMDDGYKSTNGFYFCTESFSIEENEILANILFSKFNLNCGIHKTTNGSRLYIKADSKNKLIELVKPYIVPVFNYKLDLNS